MKRACLFSVLTLCSFLAAPAPAGDTSAAEALRFASSRYEAGAYGEALEAARAVLEDEPANAQALAILANGLEAQGEDAAAEKELRATLARTPSATAATELLAENLAERGEDEAAIELFRKAKAAPFRIRASAGLARTLLAAERRDEAAAELRELFELYGGVRDEDLSAEELRALAHAALTAERIPALAGEHARSFAVDARNFFQRSFDRDREQTDLLVEWARIYADKWDLVEARRLLKDALARNPRHADAHTLLAEVDLKDFFGGTARYDHAREEIESALAVNPRCAGAHVLRAGIFLGDGLYGDALEAAGRALEARKRDIPALAMKSALLRFSGDEEGAGKIEALALARGKLAGAEFLTNLAALFDERFRYVEAQAAAKRAVEMDAQSWPAWGRLGFASMRTGDEETARKYFEKARDADPFDLFTVNQLKLLDYLASEFETVKTDRFVVRMEKHEAAALKPYLLPLLDRAWTELSTRYGVKLDSPILVEVFPSLNDFSVRAIGHRFIPAAGVTFARVVAIASPAAFPPGQIGWGRVLWHELGHVATLERSRYRVPRWLTEGISVFEESKGHKAWVREWDVPVVEALERGHLLPIVELNQGFSKPRFPNQVMLSYYQGGLICTFIEKTFGFDAILKLLDGYRDGLDLEKNLERALGIGAAEFDRRFFAFVRETFAGIRYRARCDDEGELAKLRLEAKKKPRGREAQARYALAAADMGRWADAEGAAARLRAVDPLSGDARLVDALVARHRDDLDAYRKLLNDALAHETSDPFLAQMLLGEHLAAKDPKTAAPRDPRGAIAAFEAAHALFPRHPGPVALLVERYKELGEAQKRKAMLAQLAELLPSDVQSRGELAQAEREAKRWAEEARWLEELLWLDPRPPRIHALLAEARLKLGDARGAEVEIAFAEERLRELKASAPASGPATAALEALEKETEGIALAIRSASRPPPPAPVPPTPTAVPGGPF